MVQILFLLNLLKYIDYLNFQKGTYKSINCYTIEEVKKENKNYFLNGNFFEQCDDSYAECEIIKNNCSVCQMNHYIINGCGGSFHAACGNKNKNRHILPFKNKYAPGSCRRSGNRCIFRFPVLQF